VNQIKNEEKQNVSSLSFQIENNTFRYQNKRGKYGFRAIKRPETENCTLGHFYEPMHALGYKLLYLNEQFYSVYSESYVLIHSSVHYPTHFHFFSFFIEGTVGNL
jgi:hypothetical protein